MLSSQKRPLFLIAVAAAVLTFSVSGCSLLFSGGKSAGSANQPAGQKSDIPVDQVVLPNEVKGLKLGKSFVESEVASYTYAKDPQEPPVVTVVIQSLVKWNPIVLKAMGGGLSQSKMYHSNQISCGLDSGETIMCFGRTGPYMGVFTSSPTPGMTMDQFAELVTEISEGIPK